MPHLSKWSLPAFAIRRPVTVCMLAIAIGVVGLVAAPRLPLEFIIQIWRPIMWVRFSYPGATPTQVEQEITIPAEGMLKTIPGLHRLSSWSHQGRASLALRFAFDADMGVASAEVRDRLERLNLRLPEEVKRAQISRFGPEDIPIMRLALFREEQEDELARYARTQLRNQLMRVPGVADVQVSGSSEKRVYVDFQQDALQSAGLSVYDVASSLHASSISLGVGRIIEGGTRYDIRVEDEFTSAAQLAETVVSPTGVRLKDVAEVNVRPPAGADDFTVDGQRGVFLKVIKESGANTVATCGALRTELEALRETPELEGTGFFVFEDQSEYIRFALDSLATAGQYGCAMALFILWLFLRRIRTTLVVALVIPASLLLAPAYVYFAGKSLNLITIAAMLISIGILVDNAIVVVENIHRRGNQIKDRAEAARKGAAEVSLAITAATLTTLVVFIPVMFMEAGELSTVMQEFAGPITCSLGASLVLALTVIPLAESRMGAPKKNGHRFLRRLPGARAFDALHARFHPLRDLQRGYRRGLQFVVTYRFAALSVVVIILGLTFHYPFRATGFRGFPELDMRRVRVEFRVDPNYGSDKAREDTERIVDKIDAQREELGIENIYVNSGGWGANIDLYLVQPDELEPGESVPYTTEETRHQLAELLPERIAGGRISSGLPSSRPEGGRRISVRLRGDDTQKLLELAAAFEKRMKGLPEFYEVENRAPEGADEIQLNVDEPQAASAGIAPMTIARSVSMALSGTQLPYLKEEGREIPVRGQYGWTDRGNVGDLEAMAVQSPEGQLVPLMRMVRLRKGETPPHIHRDEAKSVVEISARTAEADMVPARAALEELIGSFDLPRGYTIELDEHLRGIDETLWSFQVTLATALVLIYLLLAALFESWLLPLSVLTTVPLAFTGVYWALYATGTAMDTISLVGAVILCGVIVNNGIVIVDHINRLRRAGFDRIEAVLQGGNDRLRPVLMTSSTTILGVLPLAVGSSTASAGAMDALGRALVGGLVTGTLLTLYVVPLCYTLIDDARFWLRDFFGEIVTLGGVSAGSLR